MTRTEEINALIRETEMVGEEIAEMKKIILMEMERTERMKKTLAELKSRLA
jgi:hypothetical protein